MRRARLTQRLVCYVYVTHYMDRNQRDGLDDYEDGQLHLENSLCQISKDLSLGIS